ncbi:TlpA family protein disulfide reductase [Pedobacter rhizosphaerae]|uniref:Thiol-disulfide isomerase or thioredoxin n=1 Tax=Pedobacter rhizosphaerae TaxID=390241 RepID=A0A1H9S8M5_9SPHI|nr:TlpA family protein disulfide reductase [Pedobacter rhizosphaerae]SER81268.1 Thiol-disulfide isomerase or thioredoxin [Pedobacter rhizosphaerae]
MKKILFLLLLNLFVFYSYSQSPLHCLPDSSIVISLNKNVGFGPSGQVSSAIGATHNNSKEEIALYPVLTNIPALKDVQIFFFIYNKPQHYYQNYIAGKLSKDLLLEWYKRDNLTLSDTLLLSKNSMNTGISVVSAKDSTGKKVFMVDANHNYDLSDDVIRTLPDDGYISNIMELATKISIESFSNNKIKQEDVLSLIRFSRSSTDKMPLISFAFPEFRYARFSYKGNQYLICSDMLAPTKSVFLLPDLPSFSPAPKEARVNLNQFIKLGNDDFQYERAEDNGQRVIFKKRAKNEKSMHDTSENPSSQAGYFAPEIKGLNLIDGKDISLNGLKGKYVFIDFWSTSCGPCIADFPNLVKLYNSYDKNKIEFIGMADERQNGKVSELLSRHKITWPTLISNKQTTFSKGYNIFSYPSSFLIAPDGRIVKLDLRSEELKNVLNALLK